MKTKSPLSILFLLIFLGTFPNESKAQLKYIGLKDEANVREAQQIVYHTYASRYAHFWPKMHLFDNYVYVTTADGIYRKTLETLDETTWEQYAFKGVPIRNFVKNGDKLLAATPAWQDSILLLSEDDGKTFTNVTPPSFFIEDYENMAQVYNIASNPLNSNSLLISLYPKGVAKSTDFGANWSTLGGELGGYQDWFLGFHPNDTTIIFNTGETPVFNSFISASYDNGETWKIVETRNNHCTHELVFHPSNPNIIISGGEGRIAKSYDKGKTWTDSHSSTPIIYIYSIVYDENNPNILYASGNIHGPEEYIIIYRSTDGGETWNEYINEYMAGADGIIDMELYGGKLIIYTMTNGIYTLDLSSTNINNPVKKQTVLYPNPVQGILYGKGKETPQNVTLFSITGKTIFNQNPGLQNFEIDMANYAKGIYLLRISYENDVETEVIINQ
ncbi:hypothetical protein AGMMS50239_31070 [Bacteroidia bacterium]|nr:hypothetical protein FACS1894207_4480 [Bacteroidia bacterium]GHT67602.1 hypothetical protein AGMMS50239_31070 [Bacteroidia bacterium]